MVLPRVSLPLTGCMSVPLQPCFHRRPALHITRKVGAKRDIGPDVAASAAAPEEFFEEIKDNNARISEKMGLGMGRIRNDRTAHPKLRSLGHR